MTRALGNITRGTTHPNRLRRMDRWILDAFCSMVRASDVPLVIDLGYGASPITTLELHDRLAKHMRADVEVLGLELDPQRVADAQELSAPGVSFELGGFELAGHTPVLVRAANVLRQYDVSEVAQAWFAVSSRLAPQGWFVEGTCDEIGRLSTWVALPAQAKEPATFSMSMHLSSLSQPSAIAARLPKALIHRNVPGEPIYEFLQKLDAAWAANAGLSTFGARQRWLATVETVRSEGMPVLADRVRWRLGEITVPWAYVDRGDTQLPQVLPANCALRSQRLP